MAIYKRGKLWHMDVMINGVRYREPLETTDRREASSLEKKRIAEIQAGKGASKTGREFAGSRLPRLRSYSRKNASRTSRCALSSSRQSVSSRSRNTLERSR